MYMAVAGRGSGSNRRGIRVHVVSMGEMHILQLKLLFTRSQWLHTPMTRRLKNCF